MSNNEFKVSPKFPNLQPVVVNTFFEMYRKKYFPDPFIYSTALGIWYVNKSIGFDIVELGDKYVLIYDKTEQPLDIPFLITASHYMKIVNESKFYENISASNIDIFLEDLKKMVNYNYLLITSLDSKIDHRILYEMFKQLVFWVSGVLYGFYNDDYDKVLDSVIYTENSKLGTIQLFLQGRLY